MNLITMHAEYLVMLNPWAIIYKVTKIITTSIVYEVFAILVTDRHVVSAVFYHFQCAYFQ